MNFNIQTGQPSKQRSQYLILPIFQDGKADDLVESLDSVCKGALKQVLNKGDLPEKLGSTFTIYQPSDAIERLLLVNCGKKAAFDASKYQEVVKNIGAALANTGATEACCLLPLLPVKDRDIVWKIRQGTLWLANAGYVFNSYKSKAEKKPKGVQRLTWLVANKREVELTQPALQVGQAIASAMATTRDLGNTPPNVCHPSFMAKAAEKLAKAHKKISYAVLERKDLESLNMGAYLSVTQGSAQPPKLITLEYRGAAKSQAPIVFVGKGITFDTGGNSLKPADKMVGMKFDMCGAATVLGLIQFAAELNLAINVVGVMATAENMPGGEASRPDDIVTTMSGQTVEILNTDAEGRLVLCDTLTYCERFKPKVVIDIATLTGAVVVALGAHHSGLYSNYQPLADSLIAAGKITNDKCWQMPLTDDYMPQLDSNFADFTNVGGPEGGSITAACFLSKFTKNFHWAHLDVAGTAARYTGKDRGATGCPIPLLAQYLLDNA